VRSGLVRLILTVIASVVASVAFAWLLAVVSPVSEDDNRGTSLSWVVPPPSGWPERPQYQWRVSGFGVRETWHIDTDTELAASMPMSFRVSEQATLEVGWPLPCLVAVHRTSVPLHQVWAPRLGDATASFAIGAPLPRGSHTEYSLLGRSLPFRPLLLGLIVDSAIWLVLLYLGLAAAVRGRSAFRRALNRCPSCGYRMRSASRCPECGTLSTT